MNHHRTRILRERFCEVQNMIAVVKKPPEFIIPLNPRDPNIQVASCRFFHDIGGLMKGSGR